MQLAKAVGPAGRVIGIKAHTATCETLLQNIRTIYPELETRIALKNVAVSSKPGMASFYLDKSYSGLSSLVERDVTHGHEIETTVVKVSTLNKLVKGRPAFIKIDIEGAEYDALRGAKKLLRRRPLMAFEFDPNSTRYFNFTAEDLVGLLDGYGYAITDLFGHPHTTGANMMTAPLWNFMAVPVGMDVQAICAPARRAL